MSDDNLRAAAEQALALLERLQHHAMTTYPDEGYREHNRVRNALAAALAEQPHSDYPCRSDGRCQYAIDSGAEGMGHCPRGKCVMPAEQPKCAHRIADARNGAVASGYVCIDCGAIFAAADHAPPAATEQPQPEAPSGWRMVPVEPTKAMLAAGDKVMDCDPLWVARGYRAMIAAAPPPSAPKPSFDEWYDSAHWGNEDFREGCRRAWEAALRAAAAARGR